MHSHQLHQSGSAPTSNETSSNLLTFPAGALLSGAQIYAIHAIWDTLRQCNIPASNSGGSSVSQNKLPQPTIGNIYIFKYLQSNFIG